jgi:RNA-binding protein PNO1
MKDGERKETRRCNLSGRAEPTRLCTRSSVAIAQALSALSIPSEHPRAIIMQSDEFLPASATSAKAKKLAKLQANRPPAASSSTTKSKSKGKGKAKQQATGAAAEPAHLLSTQPGGAAAAADEAMDDIERLPLDAGVAPRTTVGTAQAGDADAAMNAGGNGDDDDDDAVMIDPSQLPTPVVRTPIAQLEAAAAASGGDPNTLSFGAITQHNASGLTQRRKISIPPHRMTPLKRDWIKIYTPLVEECGLQVRMNVAKRQVEMKVRLLRFSRCRPPRRKTTREF